MSDQTLLFLNNLSLSYGKNTVVERLNLEIARGELIALLGPSGCGKTTTMRAIAGLMTPSGGKIVLDGRDVTRVPPNKREVGLMFQSYALFPHLSVFENVAFGLKLKGMRGSDLSVRVNGGLSAVGLGDYTDRRPADLSGGQQQRVALARSLVMDPKVLLLDEPLSNLDARLRLEMRTELQRVQKANDLTMVFVTHDQSEALSLADRIVVMKDGAIEQLGTPEDIYNRPESAFVADFVGFENIFTVEGGKLKGKGEAFTLPQALPKGAKGLAWRPRFVRIGEGAFTGTVIGAAFVGQMREYVLETPLGHIKVDVDASEPAHSLGQDLAFDLRVEDAVVLKR
ncbi:ABC transporter ATP-binding protein [Martelella mediterranea]|uniref:ABC transporter ATP-binding protein n=1 Tax=Martelella mediterranea TaxID=293089 RepID=UPI001E343F4E|nr:ABC transporter ATP-binding protein [Martelella mediterranea]MCD1632509.1 ABC transporter ATP-binding protein [Martelella mediterranea]